MTGEGYSCRFRGVDDDRNTRYVRAETPPSGSGDDSAEDEIVEAAQLIQALETEPCGPALDQAFAQLGSGADLGLLLAMIKSMTRGGIPGLAVSLLTSGGVLMEEQTELAQLATQLTALPSGEISPVQIESNYLRNRAHLLGTRPHLQ